MLSVTHEQKSAGTLSTQIGPHGVPDAMIHGLSSVKKDLVSSHPLEQTERSSKQMQEARDMAILQSLQGRAAPQRILTERHFAKKVGRLPCLQSSNLMHDTLTGNDDMLTFDDILNNQLEFAENAIPPHLPEERILKKL